MNIVVAYDIRDDHRRARVAARLAAVGVRLQKSVFECVVDAETLSTLMAELEAVLDLNADVLQIFSQCADCCGKRRDYGQVDLSLDAPFWVV